MSAERSWVVDVPVGSTVLMDETGHFTYRKESELRDALAAFAYMAGWDVETEAVIPGWGGRVDVLATAGEFKVAIEVKRRLTQIGAIRKGFQQADGYRKALRPEDVEYQIGRAFHVARTVTVVLTAAEVDFGLARTMDRAYTGVSLRDWGATVRLLRGHVFTALDRMEVAEARVTAARKVLALCERESQRCRYAVHEWVCSNALAGIRRHLPAMADGIQRTLDAQARWAA